MILTKAFCVSALLVAGLRTSAADLTKITYVGGQLTIQARGCTVAEVLTRVAGLTGVAIEIPDGASSQVMPIVQLGPGPARQILSALLNDSNYDFMIQASDADTEKLHSVTIMPRKKLDSAPALEATRRSPFSRFPEPAPSKVEEAPAPETLEAPAAAVTPAAQADLQPADAAQAQPDAAVEPPVPAATSPRELLNVPKTSPVSPPATLVPQVINQQLQQMYQQRVQMIQQSRQVVPATAPSQ